MTTPTPYPLLTRIDSPEQLRAEKPAQLVPLAAELRKFLIEVTSRTGGHLAPGLGAVELTIALHYIFNTPTDRLVWDIGHQAYPHKILTGRRAQLDTIRQYRGLSGFLKRSESPFDAFGAGHASTAISAALGMAVAARQQGAGHEVVAIIGDGALTGGMAYEALNNAGDLDADLLVILNDNEMSISPNVGAITNYLARILSGRAYSSVREGSKTVLSTLPPSVKTYARRWEEHLKGMVMPSTLFEELGFYYIGPIDGHDLPTLVATLKNMRGLHGPRFLHVVTQKGRGYEPAEGDPCVFHGVTPFDAATGKLEKKDGRRTYTQVFGDWLCDMAAADAKLIGITPAMREGSGLVRFSTEYPARYFDVGIAEQHSLTFAAGLACEGMKPVVAIYSTFLQRAYDQLIHDISIQNLNVLFAIDRAGVVGADGATHAGAYDYCYLRCVPGLVMMAPADEAECRNMLFTGYEFAGPAAVRYPRGSGPGIAETKTMQALPIGRAEIRRIADGVVLPPRADGAARLQAPLHAATKAAGEPGGPPPAPAVAILAFGVMVEPCMAVAARLNATVVNMRFIKPLDAECVVQMAENHQLVVTVEDHVIMGGAGSAVNECLLANQQVCPVLNLGLPDRHIEHGSREQQHAEVGLDVDGIVGQIMARMGVGSDETVGNARKST